MEDGVVALLGGEGRGEIGTNKMTQVDLRACTAKLAPQLPTKGTLRGI